MHALRFCIRFQVGVIDRRGECYLDTKGTQDSESFLYLAGGFPFLQVFNET